MRVSHFPVAHPPARLLLRQEEALRRPEGSRAEVYVFPIRLKSFLGQRPGWPAA